MTISQKEDSIQLITFNIGQKLFGTNILAIREIVRDPEIEHLDKESALIDGIVRVRGEDIPVINLNQRMTASPSTGHDRQNWIMIVYTEDYIAGFMVDAVNRILKVDFDTILEAPDLALEGSQRNYIRGVCDSEMGMLVVLEFEKFFTADEINEIKKVYAHN